MTRWTQTWLSGTSATGSGDDDPYPGQRLGLPETGPGSVARLGARTLAILIDWLPCAIAAQLFTANPATSALALFAALTTVSIAVAGRTPGHAAMGLRVALLDGSRPGFSAAVIRTVLLCLLIPPVIFDADWRGLHDKAAGTVVLRQR